MANQDFPEISISDEKLCFIIEKAREFDVKDVVRTQIVDRISRRRHDSGLRGSPG